MRFRRRLGLSCGRAFTGRRRGRCTDGVRGVAGHVATDLEDPMTEWKAKRFWKTVSVETAEGGFQVLLDQRPVRTPGKSLLVLPTRAMAEALAAEWDAQEDEIKPLTMPVTRSANSAV